MGSTRSSAREIHDDIASRGPRSATAESGWPASMKLRTRLLTRDGPLSASRLRGGSSIACRPVRTASACRPRNEYTTPSRETSRPSRGAQRTAPSMVRRAEFLGPKRGGVALVSHTRTDRRPSRSRRARGCWGAEDGRPPGSPLEPLDSHCRAEGVVQHLERDPTAVPEIVGEVHRRGGAPAEQRLDRVPVGESPRQRLDGVGYCGAASVGCGALRYFASQACTSA